MPVINGVGQSDNTYIKQETLRDLLRTHLKVSKGVLKKSNYCSIKKKYLYIDLNAGSGLYNDISGSPIIFLETIKDVKMSDPFVAQLCEINAQSAESLRTLCCEKLSVISDEDIEGKRTCVIGTDNGDLVKIINRDNTSWVRDTVERLKDEKQQRYVGVIYSDPNGCENFDNLIKLSEINAFRMVDIVMHLSATTIKRVCGAQPNTTRLTDGINAINKKYWWIRKPFGAFQWTFIVGTNWGSFPNLKTCGFYKIDSSEGKNILNFMNYTKEEAEELFQNQNIRPIPNTSNTRLLRHLGKLYSREPMVFAKSAKRPEQLRFII